MPSTTNFGWTTPADTDLVKDGASAIRTLGNGIDTSLVDLKGGTTGQVLAKASNTDLDFTWSAADPLSILDAKGDLISATAADTPARLAVGTNGQVLTADSTASTGLKWASPTGSANLYPRLSANYYVWPAWTSNGNSTDVTEDTTYFTPIYLPVCTIDRIAVKTGSVWSGTSCVTRLGLYNNGTNNVPTTVNFDAGTITASAASTVYSITISQSITTAGLYWVAVNTQTKTSMTSTNFTGTAGSPLLTAQSTTFDFTTIRGFMEASITGAFATVGTLTTSTDQYPFATLRIS